MSTLHENEISDLIVEYLDWLIGNGGTAPDELLRKVRTAKQRKRLWKQIDIVNLTIADAIPRRARPFVQSASSDLSWLDDAPR